MKGILIVGSSGQDEHATDPCLEMFVELLQIWEALISEDGRHGYELTQGQHQELINLERVKGRIATLKTMVESKSAPNGGKKADVVSGAVGQLFDMYYQSLDRVINFCLSPSSQPGQERPLSQRRHCVQRRFGYRECCRQIDRPECIGKLLDFLPATL